MFAGEGKACERASLEVRWVGKGFGEGGVDLLEREKGMSRRSKDSKDVGGRGGGLESLPQWTRRAEEES